MKLKYILLTLLVLVLISGCQTKVNPTGEVKEFNTIIQNFQYNPETFNVNLGDSVKINIKNNDAIGHGISLPIFGVNAAVGPGQTTTIQFVANQRGNPETFCSTDHGEKLLIKVT